jgi:FMN-dependent NADH-azoreductase
MKILTINSSARGQGSVSKQLVDELVTALEDREGRVQVTHRDLSAGLPFVHEEWVAANYTPAEDRTDAQRKTLALSDSLVAEIQAADVLVIGVPVYNFSIPATLKTWVDLVARARLTFRYTEHGPEGLVKGKKAYLAVATGGVVVDSAVDFATPYLRHVLGFIGITDVEVVAAERINNDAAAAMDAARAKIAELVYLAPQAA